KAILSEVEIDICSIEEQRKIVNVLDKIMNLISARKKELSYLDTFTKARFVELFGEYYMNHINEKQLDEICDFIDYRGKTPEKSESGIPLITAKNVKDNRFSIEPQEFIPEENYDAVMTRGIPRVNDVLFTTEAPLGNVCRIPDIYERFCVGQRLITMQPHTDVINSEYLEHALASAEFQEKMWQKSSGSTVKGIRSKLLVLLTIPVPPIELQNQFRDFVHQVDKSKSAVKKALDETQLLFDSLMQEYFD
ncbi:MAG: restriction endonuclease subunit S, partial [Lachnospira sp.]|nr:restriction endonuclease subunit S [Lachnospira sp.]